MLSDRPIDILAINETKLDDTISDNEIHISGYESIRSDRSTNGRSGGGVCFFIRSEINYSVRSDLICEHIESLTVEIKKPRSRPFAVMTWYRPPDSSIDLFRPFEELIGKLDSEIIEYYVLGDLNCNMAATKFDNSTNILSNIAEVYGLDQLITEYTRITDKSSTLIDLIFTNTPDRVVCSGVSHIGISDHSLVYAYRKVSIVSTTNKHTTLRYRKFKNFNAAFVAFNDHFSSIGPKLASQIYSNNGPSHLRFLEGTDKRFELKSTNPSKVFSLLSKLCKSKATGLDMIFARLLRECADLIADPMCSIFNQSIRSGIFPQEWKCAKVIPLFKEGNHSDLNNYRPISIVPIVAKVFERIIYDQVYGYLTENNLISSQQSGFRSLHSTVTALLEATNNWAFNIDKGSVNAVVFLDLKKAFDTVDHTILLSKLFEYGIRGVAYEWFRSYLDNRNQQCFVNGSLSNSQILTCGIPQGTILGPLLFILYINDLPNCLSNSVARMYADDTHLTFASNNIETINDVMNHDLSNVNTWLTANKLTLNSSKTEFMLIGSRQRLGTYDTSPKLIIGGDIINPVSSVKSLGVHIDENLSWNMHIEKIAKKIASGIGAIKRCRPFINRTTLESVFNALVQPYFNYCSEVWGHCNKSLSNRLQKLQNRAARILTFSSYDTSADPIFEQLNWKRLDTQRQIQVATMVYKSIHGLAPDYLGSLFTKYDPPYNLRNSENKLAVPLPRTNFLKNSFSYNGAVIWNSLSPELRQAKSLQSFRNGCRDFFA